MSDSIAQICDPSASLEDAIKRARTRAETVGFDFDLSRYIQMQCIARQLDLPTIFRGLETLEAITDENKLLTILRPFLRSSVPQIASKCVLILGRRSRNLNWVRNTMTESDARIRANLIESLWGRREPEIEVIFESAARDPHHRVAANAVHGLCMMESDKYISGLDRMIASPEPQFRRAAIWLIRIAGTPESAARIKMLIRDSDPSVRRAAFQALGFLRDRLLETASSSAGTAEPPAAAAEAEAQVVH